MVCTLQKNQVIKSSCFCHIDRRLHQRQSYIFITGAQPFDGSDQKSFIVYNIRLNDMETKRRYSDFESMRNVLTRLYPIFIVPPIPEKHSLFEYAILQKRTNSDTTTIEKRKRMLQSFLNQVAKHPYLGHNHLFHQFLDPDIVWSDILNSSSLTTLLKQQPLHLVLTTQSDQSCASPWSHHPILSHRFIPAPPVNTYLHEPSDPFLQDSEEKSVQLSEFMQNHVEKSQRKVIRRMTELAIDYAQLGAIYNGFSLYETEYVAQAIERMGQTVDDAYTETGQIVHKLESGFAEPMQSQTQMARLVKQVIEFQYLKQCQVELIKQTFERRRHELDRLLQMEDELRHLDQIPSSSLTSDIDDSKTNSDKASQTTRRRSAPISFASRLMNSASYSLQSMVDVDPATTRRNHIRKSKETLQILEEALEICRNDIELLTEQLHDELRRYEKEKAILLRDTMMAFATTHLRYCQKNLQAWQDTKIQVDKIPLDD